MCPPGPQRSGGPAGLAPPLRASSTASKNVSVYVIAAATCAVCMCGPRKLSSRAYCGSSVGKNDTSDMYQPCSSRWPCSRSQPISKMFALSEFSEYVSDSRR